ncbi:MAG: helix-turn-helix transcriptional regulator [Chloroflexi bacterium]|nr:helix-turn-helix transcriptional regulator [Chloroflexota bacterium]
MESEPVSDDQRLYAYHAEMCQVFSHPKRLELINVLRDKEMSAGDLGHALGLSPANLSQHLTMMKERRILTSRKVANMVYYRVNDLRLLQAFDLLRTILLDQLRRDGALVFAVSEVSSL